MKYEITQNLRNKLIEEVNLIIAKIDSYLPKIEKLFKAEFIKMPITNKEIIEKLVDSSKNKYTEQFKKEAEEKKTVTKFYLYKNKPPTAEALKNIYGEEYIADNYEPKKTRSY